MLSAMIIAAVLATITTGMHAVGFARILRSIWPRTVTALKLELPTAVLLLMRVVWLLLLVHVMEIGVWALFYHFIRCFPDAESAFYFSGVTYTSVGYGELLLPVRWRIIAPIESLTGMLMCGLSASAFFALVGQIVKARSLVEHK